ncbi:GNAT family N-acetyltransferase [Thalassococcus sp. CAU 1522]|uniref:GNAT family N-acetyltransferase n=1 Tax=Thalassococcus arenae TaxID=2851652 RepID=A0ABS6N6S4_9RHOB|nr:GNAT family N-acetyltransferase [Thalassococcus arenae]MBV2359719.1 GNAT family N-acetyltransferase [Thalassococcus arenae]
MTAPVEQHRPGPGARTAARLGGKVPVIDTPRLQLRGPRIYDFDAFAEILCSDRAQHMGGPFSREAAWTDFAGYTALWMLHGHGLWTIDAQTQPSAGFVLVGYEYDDPEAELGIFLTETAEGQGIALEALEAARSYTFDNLRWTSVASFVDPENTRCIALMNRSGAERDRACEARLGDGTLVFRHHAPNPEDA